MRDRTKRVFRKEAPKIQTQTGMRLVTTKSGVSERVLHEEPCRILDRCGSCPMLDLPYKIQLQQKTNGLRTFIKEKGASIADLIVKDFVGSDERMGYKNSVKLVVSEQAPSHSYGFSQNRKGAETKRWIELGFYRQSLNEVVDIGRCPVQAAPLNDLMSWLRTAIRFHNLSVYTPRNKNGTLHSIVLRASRSTRQLQVIFNVTKKDLVIMRALSRDLAEKFMNVQAVYLNCNSANNKFENESELILLVGSDSLEESYGDLVLKFSPNSFMPVNPLLTARVYNRIVELSNLIGNETILDLYCGAGGIALSLAKYAKQVIGIDSSASCIKDALKNAIVNDLKNVDFYEGDVNECLEKLMSEKRLEKADVVILNPSRNVVDLNTIQKIKKLNPNIVVYLSAFLEQSLKDLNAFNSNGFKPLFIEPYDSLPGSENFEVLSIMEKVESHD